MGPPLTGSPSTRSLYTFPNTEYSDYIASISTYDDFGLSISAKGFVQIHSLPEWVRITGRQLNKIVNGCIVDANTIALLESNKIALYDFELEQTRNITPPNSIIVKYKYSDIQYLDNNLTVITANGSIFNWDLRTDENPRVLVLNNMPTTTSLSLSPQSTMVSTDKGQIVVIDPRMNKRAALFDIKSCSNGIAILDGISRRQEAPWSIGFQFSNGYAGIYDAMEQTPEVIIEPPPYIECQKYAKLIPVYLGKYMIVGYSWSRMLSMYKKKISHYTMNDIPVALCTSPIYDGLFVSSYLGDLYHVF